MKFEYPGVSVVVIASGDGEGGSVSGLPPVVEPD